LRSGLPTLSAYEAYRHVAGALLLLGLACGGSANSARRCAYIALIVLSGAALEALIIAQQSGGHKLGGAFQDEQLLAAVLIILLPFGVAVSVWDPSVGWKRYGLLALTTATAALVVTANRSAWLALLPTALLVFWSISYRRQAKRTPFPASKAVIWLAGATLLVLITLGGGRTGETWRRLQTLTAYGGEATYLWREEQWQVAHRLIEERPVFGWGVGTYATQLARFDGQSRTAHEILLNGASLSENAHNSYLQLGAEVGLPGLLLFLAIPVSIAVGLLRRLRRRCGPLLRLLRYAALAALAAQAITALANPAWEFAQCSVFQWFIFGFSSLLTREASVDGGNPQEWLEAVR